MTPTLVGLLFSTLSLFPLGAPLMQPAKTSYLLGEYEYSDNTRPYYKWNGMADRYRQQKAEGVCKSKKECKAREWESFLREHRGKNFQQQLRAVNDYGNAFPYTRDEENWGVVNYWETPYQFLEVSGNCKDYAIFKYYSLRKMGVPAERLRVIVLDDLMSGGITHAVLGAYDEKGELYILDNLMRDVVPARAISFYHPIYAINEDASWLFKRQLPIRDEPKVMLSKL